MSHDQQASSEQSTTSPSSTDMPPLKVDPSRASTLFQNITSIRTRIADTCKTQQLSTQPRLVAVSKLKPATDILALHQPVSDSQSPAQHHFGENYVQELIHKSQLLPTTIRWHFIGGLQSNKCAQLAREVKSLWAVESVDSLKKAQLLDKGRGQRNEELQKSKDDNSNNADSGADLNPEDKLRISVQVNTSGEDSKSGVDPKSDDLLQLCKTIRTDCQNLTLQGLMTIGAIARSKATTAETENEDFISLKDNRDWLAEQLGVEKGDLELSMGMSEDFESAIRQGSDEVRVGSTIFGERPPKSEAKVLEHTEDEKK